MENTSQDRTDSKICKTRQMNHRIICKTKVRRSSLLVVKATVCTSETGVGKWRKDQVVKDQDEQVKTGPRNGGHRMKTSVVTVTGPVGSRDSGEP